MRARINIIGKPKSGLAVDARVLARALAAGGFLPRIRAARSRRLQSLWARRLPILLGKLFPAWRADANIFLESIYPKWLPAARHNILIPNQEWCRPKTVALLDKMDLVLCKTQHAMDIFAGLGCNTAYIGFTSLDRYRPGIRKNYRNFLHVAGSSLQKGTLTLAALWSAHPEWPQLHIVTRRPQPLAGFANRANIRILEFLPEADLITLQNRCGVHLCPSEAEGYGHYIAEALSCGAVVLTTDAPPMNELVTPQRGMLIAYASTRNQHLGTNFYVDTHTLETAIERLLGMNEAELEALGTAARAWFEAEDAAFTQRIAQALQIQTESRGRNDAVRSAR